MERTNVSLPGGVRLGLLRDVIDRPDDVAMALDNCSRVAQWPSALAACELLRAVVRQQAVTSLTPLASPYIPYIP